MDAPVIIVGGGPVGLSLALGLAHERVRSIVLERNLAPEPQSRAMVVWPRTQEILRDWGAYDALRNAGNFVTCFRVFNPESGKQLIEVDFSNVNDVVDDPGVIVLPQNETERVLRELLARNPYCDLRTGVDVLGLTQDTQHVDVAFRTGDAQETLRAAYVVGCDGSHGVVRHALGLSLEGITYDTRAVLSDEEIDRDFDDDAMVRAIPEEPGMKLAIRFGPRTWRIVASVNKDLTDEQALSPAAHQERLRYLFGDGVQSKTLWSSIFKLHRRHAQRFVIGRVALAGDAAHLNSPAGGQGMNAGIHDAANLAWKLALLLTNRGDQCTLLESYDSERREMVTDTVERTTDRLTKFGFNFPSFAKRVVLRGFSRAIRGRGMQRKICRGIGMLSGRYTKSPIVDARHPLAGRRIDDLELAGGKRINELRKGGAALVLAGEGDFPDLPMIHIETPPKRWHVKSPVVLIVRPDGCVAAVVEKLTRDRIEAAWKRAFCNALPLPHVTAV